MNTPGKRSSFSIDLGKIVSGNLAANLVGYATIPILTRLFPPSAFGSAEVFISIASILILLANMRYEIAVVVAKDDRQAANVLAACWVVSLATAGTAALVLWQPWLDVLAPLDAEAIRAFVWLLPLAGLLGGLQSSLNHWNTRLRAFGNQAMAAFVSAVAIAATRLSLGVAGFVEPIHLVLGYLMGFVATAVVLGRRAWRVSRGTFRREIRPGGVAAAMGRYRKFPLVNTWSGLLNTVSWALPVWFLSAHFGATAVGFYALSNRMVRAPMNLVGNAVSRVFFQRAAEAFHQGELGPLVEKVYARLMIVGAFPAVFLGLLGEDLFILLFGAEWAEAGVYTQMLAPFVFAALIAVPIQKTFSVSERQEVGLQMQAWVFVTRLAALVAGAWYGSPRVTVGLFSLAGFVAFGSVFARALAVSGASWALARRLTLREILAYAPGAVVLAGVKWGLGWEPLSVMAAGVVVGGIYAWRLLRRLDDLAPDLAGRVRARLRIPARPGRHRVP